jgi:4-amino-4-deoxy-L-arabinose transferase-like glycosyltransferase
VTGAFVFFVHLATPSWGFDEFFFGVLGVNFLHGDWHRTVGVHPYLAVELIGLVPRVLGEFGTGVVRVAPATAGLATAGVLYAFARRVAGPRAAVAAAALWILLPHAAVMAGAPLAAVKIERFALLDPFMAFFDAVALYAGWRWAESEGWPWAAATGLAIGLATASKLIGALVLVPVLATVLLPGGERRTRLRQAALVVVLCPVVLWLSFGGAIGDAPQRLRDILDQAGDQNADGHATVVAGHVYREPPWWSDVWFMWKGVGPVATAALAALATVGALTAPRRVAMLLGLAIAVPFACLGLLYSISLPHYYLVWMAPLTLLAALGLEALLRRGRLPAVAGCALLVPLAVAGAGTVSDVATMKPGDYRLAASQIANAGLERPAVAVVGYTPVLATYLPGAPVAASTPPDRADAIVIDPLQERLNGDPLGLRRWVAAHRGAYDALRADRLRVFIRRASRASPTSG